ncbi:hypothetical protein BX600DRAFT_514587 [Xylariales sp. PMI_506]|nr:hypothetical protein BX600DRAFT_514587 [Xylariales sp. PMI_506]
MQTKTLLLLASGLSAAVAWTIPEGTANGVYQVHTDEFGVSTHTFVAPSVEAAFKPRGMSTKRANAKRIVQGPDSIGCESYAFNTINADNAVQGLKNQCPLNGAGQVGGNLDFYSVFGDVVAYFCNYSSKVNHCYEDEVDEVIQHRISDTCGHYVAGFDILVDRALEYGYMDLSAKFCGRGR